MGFFLRVLVCGIFTTQFLSLFFWINWMGIWNFWNEANGGHRHRRKMAPGTRARTRDSTENVEATSSSPEDMRITWVSLSLSLSKVNQTGKIIWPKNLEPATRSSWPDETRRRTSWTTRWASSRSLEFQFESNFLILEIKSFFFFCF